MSVPKKAYTEHFIFPTMLKVKCRCCRTEVLVPGNDQIAVDMILIL